MPLILEGIVTTTSAAGELNIAPMGPIVDQAVTTLTLRPFSTSKTYANLKERPEGVFHVVDDVKLLAQAAIGKLETPPETKPSVRVDGHVLADCCRWFEFRVIEIDDSQERKTLQAKVVHSETVRDFFGFNRAKHAVLEAAILATRIGILPGEEILQQLEPLGVIVEKTAGASEFEAFNIVTEYIHESVKAGNEVGTKTS